MLDPLAAQADTIHRLPEHLVLERAQAIADLVLALGQVNRATWHPDGTPETDTTHTVMLALIAADLAPHAGLDRGEVAIYALVHDLVEAYAGDTNTARGLSADQALSKAAREAAALARIKRELAGSPWLIEVIESYEAQVHPAARWVRYLDKVTPKLTHRRNGCGAVKAIGMTRDEVLAKHKHQGDELRARYPDLPLADHLFRAACTACEVAFDEPTTPHPED